jgi:uncharacterized tellurite resistance protein B-like protein
VGLESFLSIKKLLGGGPTTDAERQQLYQEALLMVLARASSADTNINPIEVESVQRIVQRETGVEVSEADVRVAAASELHEPAALNKNLGVVAKSLRPQEKTALLDCLVEVIKSDIRLSERELDFFNLIAKSLHATPAEIRGLAEGQ